MLNSAFNPAGVHPGTLQTLASCLAHSTRDDNFLKQNEQGKVFVFLTPFLFFFGGPSLSLSSDSGSVGTSDSEYSSDSLWVEEFG